VDKDKKRNQQIFRKLVLFPIIFLIQWIPATINRVQNVEDPLHPIASLYIVHVFFVTSSGWMNFVVYGGINFKLLRDIILKKVGSGNSTKDDLSIDLPTQNE